MVFRVTLSGHCFRPWATAVAIGVLAAMVETQTDTTLLEQGLNAVSLASVSARLDVGRLWALPSRRRLQQPRETWCLC